MARLASVALAFGIKAAIRNRAHTRSEWMRARVTGARQAFGQLPKCERDRERRIFAGWYLVFNVPALPRKQTVQAIARESFL